MPLASFDHAIRLDGTAFDKLVTYLEKDGGAFFIVKEGGTDNPHFHASIHTTKKLQAFRSGFVRTVLDGAHGNGAYSITAIKDLDKYYRYMCKGESSVEGPQVVGKRGLVFTDEWVESMHERYWSVNQELAERRAKLSVAEAVLAACKDAGFAWTNRERICELYIRELVRRDKPINIFALKASCNLIQIKLCPDDQAILDLAVQCCG